MKRIDIEFVNIQSHEHTKFHLQPGLNFILAEDNNVGKSTIFKVIMFAMHLPRVDALDAQELVRGGCTSAKAVFTVEGMVYTLWLFRDNERQARAFFEIRDKDGTTTRSQEAPADLREAFDIVTSSDGKVVNFNDADSIQLVVQDTPKNDEVLSKVLIDMRVEAIKENAAKLAQESSTDCRVVKARYDDATRVLSTMHHCPAVGVFNAEYPLLKVGCQVLDALEEPCSGLSNIYGSLDQDILERTSRMLDVIVGLDKLTVKQATVMELYEKTMSEVDTGFRVLEPLYSVMGLVKRPLPDDIDSAMQIVNRATDVLSQLSTGLAAMSRAFNNGSRANTLSKEIESLNTKVASMSQRVKCPIKGEVFYTYEECIPVGD